MIVVAGVTNKTDTTNIQEFTLTRKVEYPGCFKFFFQLEPKNLIIKHKLLFF